MSEISSSSDTFDSRLTKIKSCLTYFHASSHFWSEAEIRTSQRVADFFKTFI